MHRARLLALIALATLVGGFHEWANPHTAQAANYCFDETQFPQTYAVEDSGDLFYVGVSGTGQFSCTSNWRVTFVPLYQDSSGWHVGFDNPLIFPSPSGHYTAFQSVPFTPPNQPTAFTGYWSNGDGLRATRPVCAETWRVRERFTNTGNQTTIGTFYSPTQTPTC